MSAGELWRSRCPINIALEIFGDRWSLLIVRDLMLKDRNRFGEMLDGGENIATNVLSDRLARLEAHRIIESGPDPADRRRKLYRLTERGTALAPTLYEVILWAATHEETAALPKEVAAMRADREAYLKGLEENLKRET